MKKLPSDKFVSLIVKHQHRVRGFLSALMTDQNHIDDVLQNTFVTVFQKLNTFSYEGETPDNEFVRWTCTVAKFETMSYRRKFGNSQMQFNEQLIADLADMQIVNAKENENQLNALSFCIEQLPEKDKQLVKKRYMQDLSVAAIASNEGVSRQSVSKWMGKIRDALAYCVRNRLGIAEGSRA